MNGIHTPFILDERGRKLTHSCTKGKKKGRLPLKEKAPLKQLGYALFLATQESLGLGNDIVASIQLMAVFDLRAILAFAIDINRYRCTIVNGAVDDFGGNTVGYLTLNQATQRT